jgi:hypothetical protein
MPKMESIIKPSPGLKAGLKGVKGGVRNLKKLTEDKEFKMCNSALKKLQSTEGDQDADEWDAFVERKGEDTIVHCLKEHATVFRIWRALCGDDGDANIEMSEGIEFVLKHDLMPTSAILTMRLAVTYPNVAFRVIADDTSPASLKVRALLAADPENESAFKTKMREWYDDHPIDVASQATFDYIEWKEVDAENDEEEGDEGDEGDAEDNARHHAERREESLRMADPESRQIVEGVDY